MKRMKKLASLLLALVMVMGLATTAFATSDDGSGNDTNSGADTETNTGTITIDNAIVGQTYTVYQILELESYHVDNTATGVGKYAYKATSAWSDFINSEAIKDVYVNVDSQGYVTWVKKDANGNNIGVADFAKAAQKYAADNKIGNQGTTTATAAEGSTDTTTTVEFSNLGLGYYLVDSTLGTLCSLDTTNPSVTIKEKNVAPGNEKKVEEDSKTGTDGAWGSTNDADIGQAVNFQSTITAQAGAENYVFHDKMSTGLTYGSVTGITLNGTTVATSNYEVKTSELGDDCTFHVVFTQDFCDTLKANNKIVISYTATVNKDAVVGSDGNKNESKIEYGEEGKTTTTSPSETTTYTWDVDVFKYTKDGETEKPLAGAKFTLSKKADGTDPIALVNEGNNVYCVATANDTDTDTKITTDATDKFTIKGLDSDTYYLTETAAPAGYNKLAGPIKIVIAGTDANNSTKGTVTYYNYDASDTTGHYGSTPSGTGVIKVLNQTGTELPSTGGTGTTIFYVVGSILLIVAAVLLITKKRMGAEK